MITQNEVDKFAAELRRNYYCCPIDDLLRFRITKYSREYFSNTNLFVGICDFNSKVIIFDNKTGDIFIESDKNENF